MLQGNHRGLPLHAILLDIVLTGYERSYILNTQDCSGLTKYPTSGCWRGLAEHSIPPQVSNTNWRPCGHLTCAVGRPARSGIKLSSAAKHSVPKCLFRVTATCDFFGKHMPPGRDIPPCLSDCRLVHRGFNGCSFSQDRFRS